MTYNMREQSLKKTDYFRHSAPVRIMHWVNVGVLTILLMSGLQIFNAHPALYWAHRPIRARAR